MPPLALLVVSVALLLGSATTAARAGLPIQDSPEVEARIDSLIHLSVERLYDGRLDLAMAAIDAAAAIDARDPRVGLYRYRLMRANYPDDINDKERAVTLLPGLLAELENVIAICDSMIEVDDRDAAGYLYRGWAKMMKAQTSAIARKFRSAAFTSRGGKSDLDRFFELHPEGDPDANTIMGGFLYFADILPGFVKILRWFIAVPGGDRERGLELIAEGARGDGYTRRDANLLQGFVFYLIEGRVEEAKDIFRALYDDDAAHPRLIELYASADYAFPTTTNDAAVVLDRFLDGWGERTRGFDDVFMLRNRFSRARVLTQQGDHERALEEYAAIRLVAPRSPSWLAPVAGRSEISILLEIGETDRARELCASFLDNEAYEEYHDSVEELCKRDPDPQRQAAFLALAPVRRQIYTGDIEAAQQGMDALDGQFEDDFRIDFFQGEIHRLSGSYDVAAAAYRRVLDAADAKRERGWRTMAYMRLGEAYFAERRLSEASEAYEQAKALEKSRTTIHNMIEGRLRYIESRPN